MALWSDCHMYSSWSKQSLPEPNLDLEQTNKHASSPYTFLHRSQLLGRSLSSEIHGCVASFLGEVPRFDWQNLRWLAVATGIGSFTSTRVGVVLARTLAEQLDLPLYGLGCEAIATHSTGLNCSLGLALLDLGYQAWQQGNPSEHHWSLVLPLYGGEFGGKSDGKNLQG